MIWIVGGFVVAGVIGFIATVVLYFRKYAKL